MSRAMPPVAISPRLLLPGQPDLSSLTALFAGPPFAGLTGEARAIAVWRFLCERLYHYCAPAETEYGHNTLYDPVTLLNCFGFTICGVTANTLGLLFQAAGFPARIAFIRGHEGCEVFYAGRWHYFDSDLQAYHRRHSPEQHIIASREDCFKDPTLVSAQQHPSDPYYIPDRPPALVAKLFEEPPRYEFVIGEQAHSMDFVLRPGESIERFYAPDADAGPAGRWICFDHYPRTFQQYPKEPGAGGPRDRFGAGKRFGNGVWRTQWDFRKAPARACVAAGCSGTLRAGKTGLVVRGPRPATRALAATSTHPDTGIGTATVVVPFDCPYPFAGIPDPALVAPPRDGVIVRLTVVRPTKGATVGLRIRRDAADLWRDFPTLQATSETTWEADLTAELAGRFQCEIAVDLTAPAGGTITLEQFDFTGHFVCAPETLPALRPGRNRLQLATGDEQGWLTQTTRRWIRFDAPAQTTAATLRRHGLVLQHGELRPGTAELLAPTGADPYHLIVPVAAPAGRTVRWLYLLAHVQARAPGAVDAGGVRMEIAAAPDGPWQLVEHFPLEEHPHRWHFTVDRKIDVASILNAPQEKVWVRLVTRAGILGLRWRVHHGRTAVETSAPVQATLQWREKNQLRTRSAVLSATHPTLQIDCQQPPQMQSYTLSVAL